jgi:hypothetical protein
MTEIKNRLPASLTVAAGGDVGFPVPRFIAALALRKAREAVEVLKVDGKTHHQHDFGSTAQRASKSPRCALYFCRPTPRWTRGRSGRMSPWPASGVMDGELPERTPLIRHRHLHSALKPSNCSNHRLLGKPVIGSWPPHGSANLCVTWPPDHSRFDDPGSAFPDPDGSQV